MINLQDPQIPPPTQAIEIDRAIYELQLFLDTNISWLSHTYGRAYRFLNKEKGNSRFYFPEIYKGNNDYYRVTPDNDKTGTCFFVVGKGENYDYFANQTNNLRYKVGIVFWVNLEKINPQLVQNENFTQNLIRDVRNLLTKQGGRLSFSFQLETEERELREVYKEFNIDESQGYHRSPYDGFRLNLEVIVPEYCGEVVNNPLETLVAALSDAEKIAVLQSIDFSNPTFSGALTQEQKDDLGI